MNPRPTANQQQINYQSYSQDEDESETDSEEENISLTSSQNSQSPPQKVNAQPPEPEPESPPQTSFFPPKPPIRTMHKRQLSTTMLHANTIRPKPEDASSGVLPDVLTTMRQKLESFALFDTDTMMKQLSVSAGGGGLTSATPSPAPGVGIFVHETEEQRQNRESMRRSFHQSISFSSIHLRGCLDVTRSQTVRATPARGDGD